MTTDLFHTELGKGPALLMMHGGLGLDHTYLRPLHDTLAEHHRVIYYDHRGNGQSPRVTGAVEHAQWHADAAGLLDALGEKKAIIYGHSYGSWLALGFALAYPDRVKALVLCGAAPAFDYTEKLAAGLMARNPEVAQLWLSSVASPPTTDAEFGALWLKLLPLYFHGDPKPEAFRNTHYSASGFLAGAPGMATYNVVDRLWELRRFPILLVSGGDDLITPVAQARRIAGPTNAELATLENTGHFPFLENPTRYLSVVQGWLASRSA